MIRRSLYISLLALALLVPATAGAANPQSFGTLRAPAADKSPSATLHKAQSALFRGSGVRKGVEVTPLLKQLALKLPSLHGAERKRAVQLLSRPTQGQGGSNELEYETVEEKPLCSEHFCIHWVKTTADAPPLTDSNGNGVPDYVDTMDAVFEHVYTVENGDLGWKPPKSDGTAGCNAGAPPNCAGKTDVYIKEIGSQGIYGYSAPDPGQNSYQQAAYLVMDDDYNASQFPRYGGDPLPPMEVTAAHEYNHVLQFNYDTAQDTWMFESTAVWAEDRVYSDVNDYIQYLTPWSQMTFVPLTYFSADGNDPLNVKVYGDGVWNRWIESHYGDATIRDAWAVSRKTSPKSFAPGAYDASLKTKGTSFFSAFSRFATDTAEWRASNTAFAEGATFPDVDRAASSATNRPITLTPGGSGAVGKLDHTSYVLLDVQPANVPQLKLAVATPRGARMTIALVGRMGDEVNGTSQEFIKLLPGGGPGTITIDNPGQYDRLTAAVINADASAKTFSRILGDWLWLKDGLSINARVSTDFTAPSVVARSPKRGTRRASKRGRIAVAFSERMFELSTKSVKLVGPNGRSVKAKLALTTKGRKAATVAGADKVVLTTHAPLRKHTRYEVRLSRDLRDFGGNALPASALTWSFRTGR
jgi:hypothetical protein